MRVISVLLVVLSLLLLAQECAFWRRRRRRRAPPPCSARDCVVGQWSTWSACSHRCGNSGTQTRRRSQTSPAACGGRCPYVFDETRGCNRNSCKNGGTPQNGRCSCRTGYAGTCCELDVDECATQRPCQHTCRNTIGSYTCWCHSCYTKVGRNCDLRQCKINNACYPYGTVNPTNPCQNCDSRNKAAWTNNNALSCNDGVACTRNDRCSNGKCVGTAFSCLSCEYCSSDVCQVKAGYCTIVVNGRKTCFKHGVLRPGYSCQQCDTNNKHSWTNNNNLPCSDNSVKTKDDRCVNGACRGTPYTCLPCETQDGRGCPLKPGYCIIEHSGQRTCFGNKHLKPGNPCQWCSPSSSVSTWSNRDGVSCDDSDKCTRADTCRSGQCTATPFKCNTHCQFCNGNSCSLQTGFGFVNGKCTCRIGGQDYNHQVLNPSNECQWCDLYDGSSKASGTWTNRPAVPCNDKNQCTKKDTCSAGKCVGAAYSCQSSYPVSSCVKTSQCVGDGTCRDIMRSGGTICRAAADGCDKPERCDGKLGTCPAHVTDAIAIVTGTAALKDSQFAQNIAYQFVTNQLNLQLTGFSTSCGAMKLNWYLLSGSAACSTNSNIKGILPNTNTKQTITGLSLKDNQNYKVSILALDLRGRSLQPVCTSVINIDTSRPQGGWIRDGAAADLSYQASKTLQVNWGGIQTRHGVERYEWKVLYTPYKSSQASELLPLTNVNLNTKASKTFSVIQDGSKIQVTVRTYTKAGLYSDLTSDGVVIDTSPPLAGKVFDGNQVGVDAIFAKWTSTFSANWERFTDLHSPVSRYTWAVKRSGAGLLTAFKNSALNRSPTIAGLNLVSGERYCAVVRGYNEAGLFNQATSNCVLVDHDAPRTGNVNDGNTRDADYQSSASEILANWIGFSDGAKGSGVVEYKYKITDSKGGVVVAWTSAGNNTSIKHSGMSLTSGEKYHVTIRAVDAVGWTSDVKSDGVIVDATHPVFNGKIVVTGTQDVLNGSPCVYVSSSSSLNVRWSGFSDQHSGLDHYKWTVAPSGQSPQDSDFQVVPGVGLPSSATFSKLSLTDGKGYYVIIRAFNRAGLYREVSSTLVIPDSTPPSAGKVSDGATSAAALDFQADIDHVDATWTPFPEPDTSVRQYYYAVGSCSQGNYHVTNNQFVPVNPPTATSFQLSNVTLVNGQLYCTKVKAQNKAGLYSVEVSSDGFMVDKTPPIVRKARVLDGNTGADIDYQDNTTQLSAEWEGFEDLESGIKFYEFAISRNRAGVPDAKPFQNVGLQTKATVLGLSLQEDVFYFLVCAVNFAGLRKCISSDGVLIDHSPPSQGVVHDGILEPDLKYQSSTTSMAANWEGIWDLQSGIEKFEWAVGTSSSDKSNVMSYTDVGLSTHVRTGDPLKLSSGQKYIVHVRIANQGGAVREIESNGVIVDGTPPKPSTVYPGFVGDSGWHYDVEDQTFYTSFASALAAHWDEFEEQESEIWYYKWAIGVSKCGTQVQPLVNIGRKNNANTTMADLTFKQGVKYYVTVTSRNRAGLLSRACSDAFMIDTSPPQFGSVNVGDSKVADEHKEYISSDIVIYWSGFFDLESGIDTCDTTLLNERKTVVFRGRQSSSQGSLSVPSSVKLTQGTRYYATVNCINKAGLSTNVSSPVFTIDKTPPVQNGTIIVGTSRDDKWQYQANRNSLRVTWPPFADPESPVVRYDFAVGTQPLQEDVIPFEDVHLATRVIKHALSLDDSSIYYVTVRATNAAGLNSTVSAQGLVIDSTLPYAGNDSVKDGSQGKDRDFFSSGMDVAAHWEDINDPESGIIRNQYCIGTSPVGCQISGMADIGKSKSFTCDDCRINPGERMFVTVRVTNGAGLTIFRSSNGMLLDDSPPIMGDVIGGSDVRGNELKTALQRWNVSATWFGVEDRESGLEACQWTILSENGEEILKTELNVSSNYGDKHVLRASQSYQELPFNNTVIYYNVIVCVNKAGLSSTSRSNGFQVVSVWPVPAFVRDGPTHDLDYVTSSKRVHANWDTFEADALDPVVEYAYAVGSGAGQEDIRRFTSVGLSTRVDGFLRPDVPELDVLALGQKYYVTVRATSSSGLSSTQSSDGFVVDSTPPDESEVRVVHTVTDQETRTVDISVSWDGAEDQESGIVKTEYCIGTTPSTCVHGTKEVFNAKSVTMHLFRPETQAIFYVTVVLTNGAGLARVMTSEKLMYDTTPPSRGQVIDGLVQDADFINSTDSMSTEWDGFEDQESGVANCTWTLVQQSVSHDGSSYGNDSTIFEEVVSAIGHMTRQGLSLLPGARYVNKITCSNGDGFDVTSTSDGVIVDITAPLPGRIHDGSSSSSTSTAQTTWTPFTDHESGILGYRWGLGTSPGADDVIQLTSVGKHISGRAQDVSLTPGSHYYVTVEATNGAGMTSEAWSDGFTVDTSPPELKELSSSSRGWLGPGSKLTATWSSEDALSGIVKTEYCVGTVPVGCQTQPMTELSANASSVTCHDCRLDHLQTYYVSVRVWNGADLATVATTDGVHVDLTPPFIGDVLVQTEFTSCTTNCSLTSNITVFTDDESGLKSCSYATANSTRHVTSFVDNALKNRIQASGIDLAPGQKYWTVVRCENNVGLVTEKVSTASVLVDSTPPTKGSVIVSPDRTHDIYGVHSSCHLFNKTLRAHWSGFYDKETGITGFRVAVGKQPNASDVLQFREVGIVTTIVLDLSDVQGMFAGDILYVTVESRNPAGLTSTSSSPPTRLVSAGKEEYIEEGDFYCVQL